VEAWLRNCLVLDEEAGEGGWKGILGTEETLTWARPAGAHTIYRLLNRLFSFFIMDTFK